MKTQINQNTSPQAQSSGLSCTDSPPIRFDEFETRDNFQKKYADKISIAQLNWLLRFRDVNGLSECGAVLMVARKFYIHEQKFARWFANQKA